VVDVDEWDALDGKTIVFDVEERRPPVEKRPMDVALEKAQAEASAPLERAPATCTDTLCKYRTGEAACELEQCAWIALEQKGCPGCAQFIEGECAMPICEKDLEAKARERIDAIADICDGCAYAPCDNGASEHCEERNAELMGLIKEQILSELATLEESKGCTRENCDGCEYKYGDVGCVASSQRCRWAWRVMSLSSQRTRAKRAPLQRPKKNWRSW
jgi:hypothetical protein